MRLQQNAQNQRHASISRRKFLYSCSACGACFALSPLITGISCSSAKCDKLKIRVIYSLHALVQPGPDWPNTGFDFTPVIENMNKLLNKRCSEFEFISTLATGPEDAEKIVKQDAGGNIGGYIVFQMNCWNRVVQAVAKTNKPVLYVDYKYAGSGGFLVYTSRFMDEKQTNVGFVSSSRMEDLIEAVKCFRITEKGGSVNDFVSEVTRNRLKLTPKQGSMSCNADALKAMSAEECKKYLGESKILAFKSQESFIAEPVMGIRLEYLSFAELNRAWELADRDEADAIAQKWENNASEVIDVPYSEIQNSAAMYLGMKAVLKEHRANAITVNCLGGFYNNHIHAYPCLGFHQLTNEGLIGACECDIRSTATMVAVTTMTHGRPGFISDPVIDTSKRQIIYAHCVAPNKMFGPDGQTNPYSIMTHSEDRQGAAVRSKLPVGYMTTTLKIDQNKKEILLHQGKAVENDPDDRACRTKLCAEPVGDIEKLFTKWDQWGWHRVTFYGDLKEQVYELADSIGWKVVEEA